MNRKHLAALLIVLASGCCSVDGSRKVDSVTQVGQATVVFVEPDEYSQCDRREVVEAVHEHLGAWIGDFGGRLPPFTIEVLDVDEFPCAGGMAIGCANVNGNVKVVRGADNEVPALYHEACHAARISKYGIDLNHEDPRWAQWTERSLRLGEKIASGRSWF